MTTAETVVNLMGTLGEDDRVSITHGNGPQAGNLMVQQEEGSKLVPPQDLDVVGAMTQGQIGYMLSQSIQNALLECTDWRREVAEKGRVFEVTNQVLVDIDDPDFQDPTKPVGNFFTKNEVDALVRDKRYVLDPPAGTAHLEKKMSGFVIKRVKPNGDRPFRRVVPSPDPIKNIEGDALKRMVDMGFIVIGSGGGGIPVIKDKNGKLKGVFAVIDKDLAGERMAEAIGATEFYILTDIAKVKLNFGKPNEKDLDSMSVKEAKQYLEQGQFLPGSMLPKVKSCIRFLEWGGEKARIGDLAKANSVVSGKGGTEIHK
jgi:carbamate kinase